MIQIKQEFNNGIFDCLEIYDNEYKILETTNNQLWNTNEQYTIIIKKDRLNDYVSSNIIAEQIEETRDEEIITNNEEEPVDTMGNSPIK